MSVQVQTHSSHTHTHHAVLYSHIYTHTHSHFRLAHTHTLSSHAHTPSTHSAAHKSARTYTYICTVPVKTEDAALATPFPLPTSPSGTDVIFRVKYLLPASLNVPKTVE